MDWTVGANVTIGERHHGDPEGYPHHLALRRGMPVIVDDRDAPCTKMIAVLTFYNPGTQCWRARYLATYTKSITCHADGEFGYPTPLAVFGKRILIHEDNSYSTEDTDWPCSARYKSGNPRGWFDDKTIRQEARLPVLEFLKTHGLATWTPLQEWDAAQAS